MNYNLTLVKDSLRLIFRALIYLTIFASSMTIYRDHIVYAPWLCGILIILISYQLIERYVYNPVLYILSHAAFFVPLFLISFPDKCYKYLYFFMLIIECMHAIDIWKNNVEKPYTDVPWYIFLFIAIVYVVSFVYDKGQLCTLSYITGTSLLLLHFIRFYITGVESMIKTNENATTIPTKKILTTDGLLFAMIMIIFISLLCITRMLAVDNFLFTIADFLKKLFYLILQAIIYLVGIIRVLLARNTAEEEDVKSDGLNEAVMAITEPSMAAKILSGLITIATLVFLTFILIRIIMKCIKFFLRRYAKDSDITMTLYKSVDAEDKTEKKSNLGKRIKEFFSADPRTKVRRLYRIKIERYENDVRKPSDTPRQIAKNVKKTYDEDITDITNVYEKARYSSNDITEEDLEVMRAEYDK